jgi:hypothetical protein
MWKGRCDRTLPLLMGTLNETYPCFWRTQCWLFVRRQNLGKCHGSIHEFVHGRLGFVKVCARWIPKQFAEDHKLRGLDICQSFWSLSERTWHQLEMHISGVEHTFLTTIYCPNARLWNRSIRDGQRKFHAQPARKLCSMRLGCTRAHTGTPSREGHNGRCFSLLWNIWETQSSNSK